MPQALREFLLPLAALPLSVWCTYWGVLNGQPVSDDTLGMAVYDGKLQQPLSWHNVFKKLRYQIGVKPNPNKRWKEDKQPAFVHDFRAHHRLNLWVFSGVSILLYLFLRHFFSDQLAFSATLLWVVHPLGVQTVGWISGVGYVVATFFMLLGLNLVLLAPQLHWTATTLGMLGMFLLFGFCQWMAVEAMFQTVGTTLLLLLLGQWPYAVLSGIISISACANTLKEAVDLRRKVFHEQQMGQSTKFYPRKVIVVLKSLYYDLKLTLFPKRLGLYHTFGYHYEMPYIEHEDRYGMAGGVVALLFGLGIWLAPFPLKLGLLWFTAFILLFLNWITANQFVVDRYVWLPSFGVCLIAATYFPVWVYWFVVGIALMRTWAHLPTYDDEEKFYLSNVWNFPPSEVAYGNLGVVLLSKGLICSAMDAWWRGSQLNHEYDVCYYNLASMFKTRGFFNPHYAPLLYQQIPKEVMELAFQKDPLRGHLHISQYFLQKAIQAKTCHFPEPWQKEFDQLHQQLMRPIDSLSPKAVVVTPLLTAALT